jgi:hypothetical protein
MAFLSEFASSYIPPLVLKEFGGRVPRYLARLCTPIGRLMDYLSASWRLGMDLARFEADEETTKRGSVVDLGTISPRRDICSVSWGALRTESVTTVFPVQLAEP